MPKVWTAEPTGHDPIDRTAADDRPYRMFVENMRDGAATVSSEGLILYANPRLAELLSCSREKIVGTPLGRFVPGGMPSGADGPRGASFELDLIDGDGLRVPVLVGSSPLEVDGEQITCFTFADLSAHRAQHLEITRLGETQADRMAELQDAQAALTEQATHDALTGLPNRGLLIDRLRQTLSQAERSGACTAILFIDLDRFKEVNDTHGHAAGDAVLQRLASRMTAAVRPMDTVARIGGDEFVVLASDVTSPVQAMELSQRLIRVISASDPTDQVSASIGISVSRAGSGTGESMLKEADEAMYKAKSLGGGRAELFDAAFGLLVRARLTALRVLRSAVDDHRVVVHYQPIVDIASGGLAGYEALARIATPDGSILSPAAFIQVAEESGLVIPLGAEILETACSQARGWQRQEAQLSVAVNLSARQFEPGDLTSIVHNALERSGLEPWCLHLELTETALMDIAPDILRQLGQLRELGVQIGLDDFGTGYASLTHLRRLPLTFVKIDQTFVQGLGTEGGDERIVSAVIDLTAKLGLRSIAEGIETTDQLDHLRALGCDQAQGYLFALPLAAVDVPASIRSDRFRRA